MNKSIEPLKGGELIDPQVNKILNFLAGAGLPTDNIIADIDERQIINRNLPQYLETVPPELKMDARYLSKFVVGAGFGLFDYSLNSIWNEVVITLRKKAVIYGLDIFYDSAVSGKMRENYEDESDLGGIKDSVLLDTCKKLELISDTTYKKLSHILDMRNDIGISHPTNYTINAYELLGYMQTCIQDVIRDLPSEAAIQVKQFINGLKNSPTLIDAATLAKINPQLKSLASHHCNNILRTIFGLYVTKETSQITRKNISLIAKEVWDLSKDQVKYKLGVTLEGYNNNLNHEKYERGGEFFGICHGNRFRTNSERSIALDGLINRLEAAHHGWDNFYTEVPVAEEIMSYINIATDVPENLLGDLLDTMLKCRLGRGIKYNSGVSPKAQKFYDKFFQLLGDNEVPDLFILLARFDFSEKLQNEIRRSHLFDVLTTVRKNIINERYQEGLDFLIENYKKGSKAAQLKEFKKLTSSFIDWE